MAPIPVAHTPSKPFKLFFFPLFPSFHIVVKKNVRYFTFNYTPAFIFLSTANLNRFKQSMRSFQFEPLENPGSDIRLLETLPGTEAVHCRLIVTSLEAAKGHYEPLSYCWGDQTHRANIIVNDQYAFSIGTDLDTALRQLRSQHGPRTLWVDAICINQGDTSEKNSQVPLMTRIYQYGRRTLVWLGRHDSKTAPTFSMLEFIAKHAIDHPREDPISIYDWTKLYWQAQRKHYFTRAFWAYFFTGMQYRTAVSQFESIFGRPWFGRVWIIQELAVSSEVMMICGIHQISWETIQTASEACDEHWHPNGHMQRLLNQRQAFQTSIANTLENTILMASASEATDPRDRIYGVLGLVAGADADHGREHGITINYGAEVSQVFKEATARCLQTTGSSSILAGSMGCNGGTAPGLPSWALCSDRLNSDNIYLTLVSSEAPQSWLASGTSTCRPIFDNTFNLLGVAGLVLDKVTSVGSARENLEVLLLSITGLVQWSQFALSSILCYFEWKALAGVSGEQPYTGLNKTRFEAFRDILYVPGAEEEQIETGRYREQFRQFDQFMTREFSFLANLLGKRIRTKDKLRVQLKCVKFILQFIFFMFRRDLMTAVDIEGATTWCINKSFVVTERGYMGIASSSTRVGDCVVLPEGGRTPFILRPDRLRWIIRSECYIHGIMYGEAWDESMCNTLWIK